MKRRLNRAYDNMTMPDRCANHIERKLTERLESRKTGTYIKTMTPAPVRRYGWAVGVAAVCLMLVLSVGGTMVFLHTTDSMTRQRKETVVCFAESETVQSTTPGDHYQVATSFSAESVESFARVVRSNILTENWKALADKIQYPIVIEEQQIEEKEAFVALMEETAPGSHFLLGIEYESCAAMFCNWQGICMGDGLIWINETWDRRLKITAINSLWAEAEEMGGFAVSIEVDGTRAIHQYTGSDEEVSFPSIIGKSVITKIGTGRPVIVNGDAVKTVFLQETVTEVADYAFANCPALEAVFFDGDAPAQGEGVFDDSENVTVYYKPDSKGWGDTWCGRKTLQYGEGHVSLGVAEVNIDPEEAYQLLGAVLREKEGFFYEGSQSAVTITQYCERRSDDVGREVTIPYFTMADMDRDGIKELILWVSIEGDVLEDYLILRYDPYDNAEGGMVYAFMEPQQKITDLKKDGSFYWRESGPGQGESRVVLDPDKGSAMVVSGEGNDVEPIWHAWPCVRPEAVVQSYEYAGITPNHFPSATYSAFEAIISGRADNDWAYWKEQMTCWGMICQEEGSEVYVYDPDAPGCRLFGTLDTEGRFAFIGYYISNEFGEREAKVRLGLSDVPLYIVGSHLEELDAHGREVTRLKALQDYLGAVPDDFQPTDSQASDRTVEHDALRKILDTFVDKCTANDTKGVEQYLADDFSGTIPEALAGRDVYIISYDNFPEGQVAEGRRIEVSVAFAETKNPVDTYVLCFELIKESAGWKISSCDLAK